MKDQLDTRTLIIYLFTKLKELDGYDKPPEYIKILNNLLSKQIVYIHTQERVKNPLFVLEPKDVSFFLRNFTVKEIAQELKSLLLNLENLTQSPYVENYLFNEVQHNYIISLINHAIVQLE